MKEAWYIVLWVWLVLFNIRMLNKDYSLSKKKGWKQYCSHSWMLIPKINGSTIQSLIFYGIVGYISFFTYTHGGIEA
eukprot:CAMPEP_0116885116 /NCGR_PEP_ID=MMETSP0463-20121206/18327_1 /TAXON_ID=181622 /ORGANISM="Strombidinopsis sp, Strain SopsisLIS2011" /LENGTH=76 /DNA_ID=CAMNT_0004542937 /DNA_START=601 /DNA_END=828 /DNA_ORIENTATION=+